jgi:hypothetical protein
MVFRIGACLLLGFGDPAQKEITYGFTSERYVIEMTVGFPKLYRGRRLAFYSSLGPRKELCHSSDDGTPGKCPEKFVGAVATVRYCVRHWDGKPPDRAKIRELVTVVAQSHALPERPSFSKTQELVDGIGSDIQVFGYDEAAIKKSDRVLARHQMTQAWRLYRQELYMDAETKPFAIVEWRHTVSRISIVRIYSPPAPVSHNTGRVSRPGGDRLLTSPTVQQPVSVPDGPLGRITPVSPSDALRLDRRS